MENYITKTVDETLKNAEKIYGRPFKNIKISFDLKGKSAGQFCFFKYSDDITRWKFRFNVDIAKANGKTSYKNTIVHEVGHYIAQVFAGVKYIRPHGKEWKSVMASLGGSQERCHNYTIPASTRRLKQFEYKCGCTTHSVSSIIHNRIQKGQERFCKKCKQKIELVK